jgi:hypothetical protein
MDPKAGSAAKEALQLAGAVNKNLIFAMIYQQVGDILLSIALVLLKIFARLRPKRFERDFTRMTLDSPKSQITIIYYPEDCTMRLCTTIFSPTGRLALVTEASRETGDCGPPL